LTKISATQSKQFSSRLLTWFEHSGRHHLPWQQNPNAYRVWLSEIMLQQTQVITVIGYYERFLNSFPTLESLAKAPIDEVLTLWSGLGYYARARNLHKAARIVCEEHQGAFPNDLEAMQSLPGIGRSTAAAILTFAMQQSHAILDGNVKRVIARHYEISGWSGQSATLKELWSISDTLTPLKQTSQFNQAMMDMGATVCTRSKPKCTACCLNATCQAYQHDSWKSYPQSKPKKKKPLKEAFLVMLIHQQSVLLEKRVASGIWGGLCSMPEFNTQDLAQQWLQNQVIDYQVDQQCIHLSELLHRFSHYDFMIHLVIYHSQQLSNKVSESSQQYYSQQDFKRIALPTPIKALLTKHTQSK